MFCCVVGIISFSLNLCVWVTLTDNPISRPAAPRPSLTGKTSFCDLSNIQKMKHWLYSTSVYEWVVVLLHVEYIFQAIHNFIMTHPVWLKRIDFFSIPLPTGFIHIYENHNIRRIFHFIIHHTRILMLHCMVVKIYPFIMDGLIHLYDV